MGMLDRIKTAVQEIASFIWSLPRVVRYPLIAILTIGIPGLSIALVGAGGSLTIALSPVIMGYGIIWYLANRSQ